MWKFGDVFQVEADQPSPTTPGAFSLIASGIDVETTEVGET